MISASLAKPVKVGAILTVLLVVLAAVMFAFRKGSVPNANASLVRDVPHLEGKSIVYSKAFAERAGVRLAEAKQLPLTPTVRVVGTVTFDPAFQATVGARVPGLVRKVFLVEGASVQMGDPLAEVESADLAEAQATMQAAEAHSVAARLQAAREEELLVNSLTTAREVETARAGLAERKAQQVAARQRVAVWGGTGGGFGVRVIRAPMAGSLVERMVYVGQTIEASTAAFRIADLGHLWVALSVFEREIGAVREGDIVELKVLTDGASTIAGRVAHVGRIIHETTRSADVRVAVDNQQGALRPGQSVIATIKTSGRQREALCIPVSAVTYVDGHPTVFVAQSDLSVVPVSVQLGVSDGVLQEVLGGVAAEQKVVSEGVFAVKSEIFR